MEHLKQILFIDIETVPLAKQFSDLPDVLQTEWEKKSKNLKVNTPEEATPEALFTERSGIFSEFSKVVCIGVGSLYFQENGWKLRLKSIENDDEKLLLKDFYDLVDRFSEYYPKLAFSGHNIKEFDIPFLCRRMIINGIPLPKVMQLSGMKPWENPHIDTMDMWKFGDYKHFTSLSLLAAILGIPSPKSDIDGSMVGHVYWQEHDLERIAKYCLRDVLTSAKVFLKLKGIELDFETEYVSE